jgi:hypothetical protein
VSGWDCVGYGGIGVGWDGGGSVLWDMVMGLFGCSQLLDESDRVCDRLFGAVVVLFA